MLYLLSIKKNKTYSLFNFFLNFQKKNAMILETKNVLKYKKIVYLLFISLAYEIK